MPPVITQRKNYPKSSKQAKKFFAKFLFYLSFAAFLGAIAWILFFSGKISVISIKISGTQFIKNEDISGEINSEISGKYFKLINKNNLLFFRLGKMKSILAQKFSSIEKVEITRKFPGTLLINITERKPMMAVCGAECLMLDENGTAYKSIDTASIEFKTYQTIALYDQSKKSIASGDAVLDRNYISYILGIKEKLQSDLNLDTEDVFETPNLISNDIRVKTKEGWEIYFNEDIALDKEMEMLRAVLANEINPDERANLEYIDLRIDNKVFYKMKNSDSVSPNDQNNQNAIAPVTPPDANKDKKAGNKK